MSEKECDDLLVEETGECDDLLVEEAGECDDLLVEEAGYPCSPLSVDEESGYDDTVSSYNDTFNTYDDTLIGYGNNTVDGYDNDVICNDETVDGYDNDAICDDETISETNDTFNDSIGYGSVTSSSFLTESGEGVSENTDNNIDDKYDDDRDSALTSELSHLALDSPTRPDSSSSTSSSSTTCAEQERRTHKKQVKARSRGENFSWTVLSEKTGGKSARKRRVKGRLMSEVSEVQLCEIQQSLGRGEFVEGVLCLGGQGFTMCAPVGRERDTGRLDWNNLYGPGLHL